MVYCGGLAFAIFCPFTQSCQSRSEASSDARQSVLNLRRHLRIYGPQYESIALKVGRIRMTNKNTKATAGPSTALLTKCREQLRSA
jgi:hypothetical protein